MGEVPSNIPGYRIPKRGSLLGGRLYPRKTQPESRILAGTEHGQFTQKEIFSITIPIGG
jgi:hypothetical protein